MDRGLSVKYFQEWFFGVEPQRNEEKFVVRSFWVVVKKLLVKNTTTAEIDCFAALAMTICARNGDLDL